MTIEELVKELEELQKMFDAKTKAERAFVDRIQRLTGQNMDEKTKNTLIYAGQKTPTYQKSRTAFIERRDSLKDLLMKTGLQKNKVNQLLTMQES